MNKPENVNKEINIFKANWSLSWSTKYKYV